MDLYREHILDHYRHPRHWGLKESAAFQATSYNPVCGDEVTVQLTLQDSFVEYMCFTGKGSAI
jgi:nitrogen fixation NifU-like protein